MVTIQSPVLKLRTYDLLTWLLPATNHFPRAHRHTLTRRLLDATFDLRERLEEANMRQGQGRLERLALADEALAHVRMYLRLATRPDVCVINPLPVLQGFPWERHAPAWLLEPGWSPALPGESTGVGLANWYIWRFRLVKMASSDPR
jgi:hypothetical protein